MSQPQLPVGGRPIRTAIAVGTVWTVFAIVVLIFGVPFDAAPEWYWTHGRLACMALVGAPPECYALQAVINDTWWRLHTLPILLMILAGYVAVVAIWARGRLGAARLANPGQGNA